MAQEDAQRMVALKRVPTLMREHGLPAVSYRTLKRWYTRGIRGRRLEVTHLGGRVYTTIEKVREFCTQ